MDELDLARSRPWQMYSLLSLGEGVQWSAGDLADLIRHQLSLPLAGYLRPADRAARDVFDKAVQGLSGDSSSLADLLAATPPPLVLLTLVKEFAKKCDQSPADGLPTTVATALYYAAISAALATHSVLISDLPNAELRRGMQWALGQAWVPAELRDPLLAGLERLEQGDS